MKNHRVLLLNQDYTPLSLCPLSKAFLLVYLNKAEILESASMLCLRSISTNHSITSIIRLKKYIHLPFKRVVLTRQNIFRRDHYQCQYCGSRDKELTLDHVLPKSRGGLSKWENLTTACKRCNFKKGDLTPEEAGMTLLKKPYKPSFIMFIRDISSPVDQTWLPYLSAQ